MEKIGDRQGSELIIGADDERLYHIGFGRQQKVPTNMLIVGDPDRAQIVSEFFDNGIEGSAKHREFHTLWGHYQKVPVAVIGTGIGPDNTEIVAVERHAADEYNPETMTWGEPVKRTVIRVGTSGSPQKNVPLGSLAITEHAIGLDNTGLYYLHHESPAAYADPEFGPFYTPGNEQARMLFEQVRKELWANGIVRPYVSTMTPDVVTALQHSSRVRGIPQGDGVGAYSGLTTTAPGFFAPQGRSIGRLSNILIPDLQDRLARISVQRHDGSLLQATHSDDRIHAMNNEMEASVLARLHGEILGDNAGAVCLVIANRQEGSFISNEELGKGVRRAIQVALDSIVLLA